MKGCVGALLACAALLSSAVSAKTFTVKTTAELKAAVSNSNWGDTIEIDANGGPYETEVNVEHRMEVKGINLDSSKWPEGKPKIKGRVQLFGKSKVSGLDVSGGPRETCAISLVGSEEREGVRGGGEVYNCYVHDSPGGGICSGYGNNYVIAHSYVKNVGYDSGDTRLLAHSGISIWKPDRPGTGGQIKIFNNQVDDTKSKWAVDGNGIIIDEVDDPDVDGTNNYKGYIEVSWNQVYRNAGHGIRIWESKCVNLNVMGNTAEDNGQNNSADEPPEQYNAKDGWCKGCGIKAEQRTC